MFKIVDGVKVEMTPDEIDQRNAEIAEWEAGADERAAKKARKQRDAILSAEVDPIVSNPLRWAALTAEQQQAWADYRQALLDIPQQAGFPHDIIWPTKPTEGN